MRSKKETILVVGNGVIGASLVYGMNNSPNYKIYLSRYKEGKVNKSKIFKQDIPTSASKSGGLSNLWHSVIDLKAIRLNDLKESNLSKYLFGKDFTKNITGEYIPYIPIRPKKILKKKNYIEVSPVDSFEIKEKNVIVKFIDGTHKIFDRIFVCHGALPKHDCIINSNYAEERAYVSDHIVAQLDNSLKNNKIKKPIHYRNGHSRSCEYIKSGNLEVKLTFRPTYKKRPENLSHLDKGIYNDSLYKVIINVLKKFDLNIIKQSLFLRFGLNFKSKYWVTFIQFNCDNAYIYNNKELKENYKEINDCIKTITNLGFKIDIKSLMSGIHFYNTYQSLSNKISVNKYDEDKLVTLISPSYEFHSNASHFTFKLMLIAEKIGKSLCQRH